MNIGYKKVTFLLSLICLFSFINSFIFRIFDTYLLIIFLVVLLIVSYLLNGLNRSHKRFEKDVGLIVLIIVSIYYLIIYLSGLFVDFTYNGYSLKIISILSNILKLLPIIIIMELLRFSINYKLNNNRFLIVFSCVSFFLLDTTLVISNLNHGNISQLVDDISLFVIPCISKNILLTYLSIKTNYRITIIYRLITELPIYIVPIVPDLGTYLESVCKFVLPIIVLFHVNKFYYKLPINRDKIVTNKKKHPIMYGITIIALVVIVALTSGLFKHQAIVIASGSMRPYLYRGDIVIIEKLNKKEKEKLDVGDILVFHRDDNTVVHRIYKKVPGNNEVFFETKGDNNKKSDGYLIEEKEVIGTSNYKIKFLGLPTVYLYDLFND